MIKKLISHSVIYAIGPQLPKIVGFFLLPFLTPYLTPIDFGVWGIVTSVTMFMSSARDFGLVVPMLNSFYKHENHWKWVWRQIISYMLFGGILLAILQALSLYILFPKEGNINRTVIIILTTIQCLIFDVPNIIGTRYFQLKERPIAVSIVSIIGGTVSVASQFYFIVFLKMGYMGWVYSTFISLGLTSLIYLLLMYNLKLTPILKLRKVYAKPRFKVALPLLPHNYSAYLLNASDRVMLKMFNIPSNHIGLYNLAYMWGNYMEILGNAIGLAVGPIYLKMFNANKKDYVIRKLTSFLQISFILGSFLAALWTKELFDVFIKNEVLKGAYPLSIVIIMSYAYRPLYWSIVNRMQYDEETAKLWKISFLAGVINIVLNIIFLPIYGYQAAAFTTFIAMLYQGFVGHFFYKNQQLYKKIELLIWLLILVITTGVAYCCRDLSFWNKFILSSVTAVCWIAIINIRYLKTLNKLA